MKSTNTLRKPWTFCVGSDRLSTMLRTEYWERFRTVQAVMGFQYIRCHGLLGDELGVVRVDQWQGQERTFYNFSYLDQIFDTMLAHGVKPFVEWGFMPAALASGEETVFWWKGNITPPKDWSQWGDLVRAVTKHWVERYGLAEVRTWLFEVWNEPNLTNFWKDADQEAYFKLYETTSLALRDIDPQLRVGGPAICGGSDHWIESFLEVVRGRQLPLDFFTRHLYAAHSPSLVSPDFFYQTLVDPTTPIEELREVRRRIDAAGFAELPLHITEFNTSYHPLCPVHDTPLNAAFLARLLSEAGELVDSLSYWTFSDLFEEADVPRAFFHGGFGLLARAGIPKPTFHLFEFFQHLGPRVVHRDARSLVTQRPSGEGLALVAWNPVVGGTSAANGPLDLTLDWPHGRAVVRRRRVHDTAANPWAVWNQLGRPRFPDRDTVDFLRLAAVPETEVVLLEPTGGRLVFRLDLEPNEVTLVEILPFVDESATYWGLDDNRIRAQGTGSGASKNLLLDYGYSEQAIEERVQKTWQTMFFGEADQRIYWPDGPDRGYMVDTGNNDVRTEGMSYGMMMAVQMGDQDVFNRLWLWSKTFLQHQTGPYQHYFAWSANLDGTRRAEGPAPDGEEYFALALFFASHRWGEGKVPFDYAAQARTILRACVHKGEDGVGHPMWDPATSLIRFVPETPWTDPSYHLPHFYELFALWADPEDKAFWQRAAEASRAYLPLACHPATGLAPEYSDYDGKPHQASWDYGHHHFYSDSYRVAANLGLDSLWFGERAEHKNTVDRIHNFFSDKEVSDLRMYAIDGTPLEEPALHPQGLLATNAMGALATKGELARQAVERFWATPLRTGSRRYYDNCLILMSLLALSGRYRIWAPA